MNIQEQHIEINLSLQKVASNVKRKFLPEEIDWVINKQIQRFIKSKIKVDPKSAEFGFQADGVDLDAVRTLIVLDHKLDAYKKSTTDAFILAELPGNYSHLIENKSSVVGKCATDYAIASAFVSTTEYIYSLKVPKTTKADKPYYVNTSLAINAVTQIASSIFPVNLPDKDMTFVLDGVIKNQLLDTLTPYKLYWERYRHIYRPGNFLFVSRTNLTNVTLVIDGVTITATPETSAIFTSTNPSVGTFNSNRLVKSSKIGEFQDSAFAKSKEESPISGIEGNTIKVYHDDTFIVNTVSINYIRKPKIVSLSLGQGCDLPEEYHQDICDWTVEYLKGTINDPSYQWKLQDNELRGK